MLRPIQVQRHHGGRRSGSGPSPKYYRQNNPFFRRPYIEIRGLKPNRIDEITLTRGGSNPRIFAGIVWTIQIHNKNHKFLSKHASTSSMETAQVHNGTDINS